MHIGTFEQNQAHHIDVLDGLKTLPDDIADVIIFDPPYNIGKNFGNNEIQLGIDEYVGWAEQWITEGGRVLRTSGTFYIYGLSENLAHLFPKVPLSKRWLVWHYTNKNVATNPFWQRSHESIICAWKKDRIFNRDDVREPYTKVFLKNAAGKKRKGTDGRYSKKGKETVYEAHDGGALPRDVIKVPALAGGAGRVERFFYCKDCNDLFKLKKRPDHEEHAIVTHPTQKPLELSHKLLQATIPKDRMMMGTDGIPVPDNGVAIIPFAGTGSELYAAKQLGMSAVGFDLNEDYVAMANLLLEKGYPQ